MSRDNRAPTRPGVRRREADAADEVREVQNPALGAVLLWRAAVAYAKNGGRPAGVPLPALYLVLPIVLHGPTLRLVIGTKPSSGLRKFASKFTDSREAQTDVLLDLHPRARLMRGLSTEALRIAVSGGLLRIVPADAVAFATERKLPADNVRPIEQLLRGAERVGHWFRPLSLSEISFTLNVRF